MIRLEMKNYSMILIEKQPKYRLYHQVKLRNMNILVVKIYYDLVNSTNKTKIKEQTKSIEDKSNNQSKATIIFNDLINKRKKTKSELHDSVDYNNLKFQYVNPTKDVCFYEYMDSKNFLIQ